ncbi:MAG: response regulator [Planctomycetota bacterium]|nr:response regulator [Planctomycetota bacterium]
MKTDQYYNALVVEDNLTNRMILCSFLSLNEIQYEEADNGAVAVERCKKTAFDIILMDCQMPVLDGYAATKIIREKCPLNRSTPILAVTANVSKGNHDRCLDVGMNGFLSKPYSEESLMESIRGLLGLKPSTLTDDKDPRFFDPSMLTELLPLDSATQREIVTSFIVELKDLFDALYPWPDKVSKEMIRYCQGLKGLAANLGMLVLRDDLEALRKSLHDGETELAKKALKQCQSDWSKTAPLCDKFLRDLR